MSARPSASSSVFISDPAELTTENTENTESKLLAAPSSYHILSILRHPIKHFRASLKFHPPAEQAKFPFNPPSSFAGQHSPLRASAPLREISLCVASFAPAHVALRAAFGRLPGQRPLARVPVSAFRFPVSSSPAFTLIELLVTITVIAILAGITLAAMGGVNQKATRDKTKAEIAAISNALEQYKSVNDSYPSSISLTVIGPFYQANKVQTNATGQLLDSYGTAYQYLIPGTKNPASFDVWSNGKSSSDSTDDIGNW